MLSFCRCSLWARTYFRWSDGQKYVWVRRILSSKLAVKIGDKSPRWRRETESSEIPSEVMSPLICSGQIRSPTFLDATRITAVQYYILPIYRIHMIQKSAFQLSEKMLHGSLPCPIKTEAAIQWTNHWELCTSSPGSESGALTHA